MGPAGGPCPWNALFAVGFHLLRLRHGRARLHSLRRRTAPVVHITITPLMTTLARVPISIAGLGVQEAGFVYFYGVFGMPAEIALLLSLVLRACTILSSAPGAWFYIARGVRA